MQKKQWIKDGVFALTTVVIVFFSNIFMQERFNTRTLIPMTFVLGVFIISLHTKGYFWGITMSLVSVLAVNYAFTFPYYAVDLISPECVFSAVVMLIVSIMTGTLTTKVKRHEQMKSENERERMRANLLRAVSHDLRTPLTTIYGSCSTIIENYDALTKEQIMKHLGEINQDSRWLIRMVENLLLITRIDSEKEKIRIDKLPIALEELIDAVLVKFQKRCPGQEVEIHIPEDFLTIPMDAMLMEQVLLNLLENAVYHAAGMTKLKLEVRAENGRAVFSVSDNGCGMDEDQIAKILAGHLTEKDIPADGRRNNMGIGLSVCAAIVKAHDSQLFVKNINPGTKVFFSLKMEEEDE